MWIHILCWNFSILGFSSCSCMRISTCLEAPSTSSQTVWIGNLNRQTFVIIPSSKSSIWKSKIEFNFLQIRELFIFLRKNEQKCWIKKICFKFKNSLNTNFRVSLNPPVLQTRIRDQTHTKTREIGRFHSRDDFPCVFGKLKAHCSADSFLKPFISLPMNELNRINQKYCLSLRLI